jgi:hypothetical protein
MRGEGRHAGGGRILSKAMGRMGAAFSCEENTGDAVSAPLLMNPQFDHRENASTICAVRPDKNPSTGRRRVSGKNW